MIIFVSIKNLIQLKSLGFELEKKSDVFIVDFSKKPENSKLSFPKDLKY